LVFRRDGHPDKSEFRDKHPEEEPSIDGRLIVEGQSYVIRGVEWILRRDGDGDMPRFICTLLAEPTGD
jgi:hypothetical protein